MTKNIPTPFEGELPSKYAERLGIFYASLVNDQHKKDLGQFFTPLSIANFMAGFVRSANYKNKIKILDPGCGIGILSTSLIENLILHDNSVEIIDLVVFETDIDILVYTEACFNYLRNWLNHSGIELKWFLCKNDFILHNSLILQNQISDELYDIVISNPPYFKLPKDDLRAVAAKNVIHGQSNIYSIFLLIAALLLNQHGKLIFITPRSFCSGSYFRLFREIFFSISKIDLIHVFNSRRKTFKKDNVLQENIIIVASRKLLVEPEQLELSFGKMDEVIISISEDADDLAARKERTFLWSDLVNLQSYQKILHLPSSQIDEEVIKILKTWTGSLAAYGLKISTGPIVDFRVCESITVNKTHNVVPLIWLHNVEPMIINWPKHEHKKGKYKGQYIIKSDKTKLISNGNYVLLRRFSTKEDKRRLVAAPYLKKIKRYSLIGIENHLNYIYKVNGDPMSEVEALGISGLLNSKLFDIYFRTFNGSINVSATELKDFPLPSYRSIIVLGEEILKYKNVNLDTIDTLVSKVFDIKLDLLSYG